MIPFGEWMPDLPDNQNPGATEAKNVLPAGNSYLQINNLVAQTDSLDAQCQGAAHGRDTAGNAFNFAGDASKLYKLTTASWSDVSGSSYSCAADDSWQFAQYGSDVIAMNVADYPQKFTMGTDVAFSDLTTEFKAACGDVVKDFFVVGNTNDTTDGAKPTRIRWSAQGNHTNWTVSPVTMADYDDGLNETHGWITRIVGGSYGTIFQERAISRMIFIGSPVVFQIEQMESGKGTQAPNSVVKFGDIIAYLGNDGFYLFDGVRSTPIGNNKIDKTFFSDLDQNYMNSIYGVNDPINNMLLWSYASVGNNGIPNKILAYNYSPNAAYRWSYGEIETECLTRSLSEGYTAETLESYNSSLDAITISLDSRYWTGGNIYLSAFNNDHKLCTFTGDPLDATIETAENQLIDGMTSNVMRLRPIIDGSGTVTCQIGTRNLLSNSVTWGNSLSQLSNGDISCRSKARYHRFRINISGGFNFAQGIDITRLKRAGRR